MNRTGLVIFIIGIVFISILVFYKINDSETFDDTIPKTEMIDTKDANLATINKTDNTLNAMNATTALGAKLSTTNEPVTSISSDNFMKDGEKISYENIDISKLKSDAELISKIQSMENEITNLKTREEEYKKKEDEYKKKEAQYQLLIKTYGYSFVSPNEWSIPQKRPPVCIPSKPSSPDPLVDQTYPDEAMVFPDTSLGSMLPKYIFQNLYEDKWYDPEFLKTLSPEEKKHLFP